MEYIEFRKILKKNRISLKDISTILNISYSGVLKWKNIGIPQYAIEFLKILERLSAEERELYLREKLILN